jgi:uncharacterized protein YqjF (DUF2071 family)
MNEERREGIVAHRMLFDIEYCVRDLRRKYERLGKPFSVVAARAWANAAAMELSRSDFEQGANYGRREDVEAIR